MRISLFLLSVLFLTRAFGQTAGDCSFEAESHCFDATCGLPLYDPNVLTPCTCGENNIGSMFGGCVNGFRELNYFWKPPAVCTGGISLPPPVPGIPCELKCPEGTFLNTVSSPMRCIDCEMGTYSSGTGHTWNDWHYWPGQFRTYCSKGSGPNVAVPCEQWELGGEFIDSGDNHLLNSITSNLELRVLLMETGNITFWYRVSAEEGFDYLAFIIDDVQYLRISNSAWLPFSQIVTAGYHTLKWQYFKDVSLTRGEDKAFLKSIRITGITYGQTSCTSCPPGHFGNSTRAVTCYPCPPGTYNADTLGATSCLPCPAGTTSFEGATRCTPNQPCSIAPDSTDITYYYTPCTNGIRLKRYAFIEPPACDTRNITLPADEQETCVPKPCLPGQYRDITTPDKCVSCLPGTYSSSGEVTSCSTCTLGQSTNQRVQHINSWPSTWEAGIDTGCDGDNCIFGGWRKGYSFTDSGPGLADGTRSWLQLTTTLNAGSEIFLRYSLPCNPESNFIFSIDGTVIHAFDCEGSCSAPVRNYSFVLPANYRDNTYALRWTYEQRNRGDVTCYKAMIQEIRLTGVSTTGPLAKGGSTGCVDCAPGTYANQAGLERCLLCSAGSSSDAKSSNCSTCSPGTFADRDGTPSCVACGIGTTSNAQNTRCTYDCSQISVNSGSAYNIVPLGHWSLSYTSRSNLTGLSVSVNGSVCDWDASCNRAYICLTGDDTIRNRTLLNVGRVVSFEESTANRKGIILHYSGESGCSAHLSVVCDPTVDVGTVSLAEPFDAVQCKLNLTLSTKYGCPLCTSADFAYQDSNCQAAGNGDYIMTRNFLQINPYCYGGTALPLPKQEKCYCQKNNGGCDPLTSCIDYFGGRNCSSCPPDYAGTGYTQCSPICSPPCQNNGICSFPHTCDCGTTGFTGKLCQTPVCEPGCLNQGKCVSPNMCDCSTTGYNGTICNRPICDPPCANKGMCIAASVCDCTGTDFMGARCETERTIVTQGISRGVVVVLVVIGVVVLGIAVGFLIVLYRKHQRLYSEYSKLASNNIPLEDE